MYSLIRSALFMTSPETAHELALESLRLGHTLGATKLFCARNGRPVEVTHFSEYREELTPRDLPESGPVPQPEPQANARAAWPQALFAGLRRIR